MAPRICTSCETPHITTNWYVVESRHPLRGQVECAHEDRIRREMRDRNEYFHVATKAAAE